MCPVWASSPKGVFPFQAGSWRLCGQARAAIANSKKGPPKNQKLISHLSESDRGEIVLLIFFLTFFVLWWTEHVRQAALIGQHVGGPSFSSSFFSSCSPLRNVSGGLGSQPLLGKRSERTYTFLCQVSLTVSLRARRREQKRKCGQWAQGTSNQRLGGDTQFWGTLVSLCKHFVFFSCRSVCGVVAFYF